MTKIVVVGSINMDVIINVDQHPIIGETLKGKSTAYSPGGKGANQAVEDALRFASAAAALTVTRQGAQASIPSRQEIAAFVEEQSS